MIDCQRYLSTSRSFDGILCVHRVCISLSMPVQSAKNIISWENDYRVTLIRQS